jgi:arylformamidase
MMLLDISRRLEKDTPTWPGDTPFSYEVNWTKEQTGSVNVGRLTMSIHTGTHIDAPFHFDTEGRKVHELDLNIYIGRARVIDVSGKESIGAAELAAYEIKGVQRLLLYTGSWITAHQFPQKIPCLRPDIAPFLSNMGIRLIGIDVPSVDPLDSKELAAHHALHSYDIHILEGILLDHINPGEYELIAFPLPITGADGSPVRAVLRSL